MTQLDCKPQSQTGAALIVALIFLVVMTILALSMSRTTTVEERMAGNARDANSAFQGAEAALSSGEKYASTHDSDTLSAAVDTSNADVTAQNDSWWNSHGTEYGTTGKDTDTLNSDPHYVVRIRSSHISHGSLGTPPSEHTTSYFDVIGRSRGTTPDSESVTDSVVAIPD